jgi:hypothetical protein
MPLRLPHPSSASPELPPPASSITATTVPLHDKPGHKLSTQFPFFLNSGQQPRRQSPPPPPLCPNLRLPVLTSPAFGESFLQFPFVSTAFWHGLMTAMAPTCFDVACHPNPSACWSFVVKRNPITRRCNGESSRQVKSGLSSFSSSSPSLLLPPSFFILYS